jgi:hypothetical protein
MLAPKDPDVGGRNCFRAGPCAQLCLLGAGWRLLSAGDARA